MGCFFLPQSFCLTGSAGDGERLGDLETWRLGDLEPTGCNPVALSIAGALIFLPPSFCRKRLHVLLREKDGDGERACDSGAQG